MEESLEHWPEMDGWIIGCPTTPRRQKEDIIWLFVGIHFTATGMYGHLRHSLRSENSSTNIAMHLLLFLIDPTWPMVEFAYNILSTLWGSRKSRSIIITSDRLCSTTSNTIQEHRTTSRDTRFLLAQAIGLQVTLSNDTSVPLGGQKWSKLHYKQKEKSALTTIGQLILLLFLTTQLIGVVTKTMRRILRGDDYVLNTDYRIFWVALSALGIVVQSLAAMMLRCEWRGSSSSDTKVYSTLDETQYQLAFSAIVTVVLYSIYSSNRMVMNSGLISY